MYGRMSLLYSYEKGTIQKSSPHTAQNIFGFYISLIFGWAISIFCWWYFGSRTFNFARKEPRGKRLFGFKPTYKQVGQQFQQTKLNLQAENSGKKVLDRDVAKKVIKEITRPIVQCRVRVWAFYEAFFQKSFWKKKNFSLKTIKKAINCFKML